VSIDERENWGTGSVGSAVRAPKAAELIAQRLRSKIVRGEIAPGEMLPSEKLLMAQFAVSRPTLREAFRILESEGRITVLPGSRGGPQATVPDLGGAARHIGLYLQIQGTTLEDLLEARTEFEPICVRLLAERCTDEGLTALEACVDTQKRVVSKGLDSPTDFAKWVALTAEFHELIANYCGNKTLGAQARALRDVFDIHRQIGIQHRQASSDSTAADTFAPTTVADYERLMMLVRAHDADGAEQHWRHHLEAAAQLMFQTHDKSSTISLFA
jgi:DNA-binding FadR family transcriptional regulator